MTPTDPANPAAPKPSTTTETLAQKIDQAIAEAGSVVSTFYPVAGVAIDGGAEVEPIIAGLIGMFVNLFTHKATKANTITTTTK